MAAQVSDKQLERLALGQASAEERAELVSLIEQFPEIRRRYRECQANLAFAARLKGVAGKSDSEAKPDAQLAPTISEAPDYLASPLVPDAIPPSVTDSFTGYQIIREIHRGGQGIVYQAIQKATKRKVAIKVMKEGPFASRKDKARFEREVEVLGQLKHPNIVAIHDSGIASGNFYFVMDYISGQPLDVWMASGQHSIEATLKLFATICEAVNAAHLRGVIHRDLKPGNIRIDSQGNPHILDFGLAKTAAGTEASVMTVTGQFMGSLPWASPEQAEGVPDKIDVRTDVYSLGVILYQMLTSKVPYEVIGNMRDVLDRIMKSEPTRPSTIRKQVNDEVETIVLKCLSKERERRYQSAGMLADDIQRYLKGDPIEAKRDSALYVLKKALARYKLPTAVAAGFVILITASLLVSVGLWRQASHERDEATRQRKAAEYQSYLTCILGADSALRLRDPISLHRYLDEAPQAYRNWEWNFLKASADQSLATLRAHSKEVTSVTFSPDGTQILTGSYDGSAKLWDATTGKERLTLRAQSEKVTSVGFSPDGARIVTGFGTMFLAGSGGNGAAKLWDAATGKELAALLGHDKSWAVASVTFSPDGTRILTGSYDGTAKLWDAATKKELMTFDHNKRHITSVAFSPNGKLIFTADYDGYGELWDTATGKEILTVDRGGSSILSVAFSPDGAWILAANGHAAQVWDAFTGKGLLTLLAHGKRVTAVAFSPDGTQILTGSDDGAAKLWDAATGKELVTLLGHSKAVSSVAFSPDGTRILTGSHDGTAKLWDAAAGKEWGERDELFTPDNSYGSSVAFSPDGTRILTVPSCAISPDGMRILQVGGGMTRVLDVAMGTDLITVDSGDGRLVSAAFSPDGMRILTGSRSNDNTTKLWDATTGKELVTLLGHSQPVSSVAFSPDGTRILTGSWDGTAKLWDAAEGKELITLQGHKDRDWISSLWGSMTGKQRYSFPVRTVAFSPDGRRILTDWIDCTAKLWDATTGKELITFRGHEKWVYSVAFSPDGTQILTGSYDGTAKLWDAATGEDLITFRGHSQAVSSVAFSPDGTRILTGSGDNSVKLWEAAAGKELITLRARGGRILPAPSYLIQWDSVPWAIRFHECEAAKAARSQVGPLVDQLFAGLSDWSKVASAIRERKDLSPDLRTQALNIVLAHSTAKSNKGSERLAETERERLARVSYGQGMLASITANLLSLAKQSVGGVEEAIRRAQLIKVQAKGWTPGDLLICSEYQLLGGDAEKAAAASRQAVQEGGAGPHGPEYLNSLGLALLHAGRREEAKAAFEKVIDGLGNWSPTPPAKAFLQHWTAAYFLDLVTQDQFTERYRDHPQLKQQFACFPWFYIGQRMEIEGKRDEAIAAYRKSIELSKLPGAHYIHNWSAYRHGILTGTLSPTTASTNPASAPATTVE